MATAAENDLLDNEKEAEDLSASTKPLVKKTLSSHSQHHKKKKPQELIIQVLPPSPEDFCTCCDPCCLDVFKLSVMTTIVCWLLLGIAPVIIGLIGIFYASKAKTAENERLRTIYTNRSLTISWIGMLLFTTILTCVVIILATSGML